jgi:HD-like signal output (HDOD) protein
MEGFDMTMDPKLLQVDIPARPQALVKLEQLLTSEDVNLQAVGDLIEGDMALAAAVMKTVSSPLYGLKGRVQTVRQAVTYLGMREISAVTYEVGLRSMFPSAADLNAVWERARMRGLLMGRLAHELGMDAWSAHTAGLFEECGKAVLFKHAQTLYQPMLNAAANDVDLVDMEVKAFGTSFDLLGAKLCESWGLSAAAVASVQHHVRIHHAHQLPRVPGRFVCVLSGLAYALMTDPDSLETVTQALAPQAMLDQGSLLKGARKVQDKLDDALQDN